MDCAPLIDLLFVVDNSGSMGEEQLRLADSLPYLVARLETLTGNGVRLEPDINAMVTSSDFGNPLCTPFEPADYDPARGAPIDTACLDRLSHFTNLVGTFSIPEACQTHCPAPVEPTDPFVHFAAGIDNIPDTVVPTDIDGDGNLESPAAQALACLVPQGINGCGYEAQLENMLQALNPAAEWNQGPTPFLRDGATLAIVLITDEADCSVQDYSMMEDPLLQNINPDTGSPGPSSAICWNAGMDCTGPDAMGVYSDCQPQTSDLQELTRYTNYLVGELRENQGKEVVMLGVLGIPTVTAHDPDPPFQPTAGGVLDLVYRNWIDFPYPAGDILPDEWDAGVRAADKQFELGIGPGCTGTDLMGNFTTQAIPPGRILDVCQALDYLDATGEPRYRCCMESICDDDFTFAMSCFLGLVGDAVTTGG